jgi:RNA polymerase sigma-70 factor (ECF subfamily)
VSLQAADDVYLEHRDALFGLAYRMLGSISDAEDVVADAYLRWRRDDRGDVENPRSFLLAVTARLSLDLLKSAQRTRVDYVGSWLPEPLVTPYDDLYDDPAGAAETADTISLAFLYLLERLSPQERAVFVLRSAFDFPYARVAEVLELSVDNVRQLHRRARQRLGADADARYVPDPRRQRELVDKFLAAAASGAVEPFAALLAEDVLLVGDGGGKAAAVRAPFVGRLRVARFMRGLVRKATPDMCFDVVRANGAPAILVRTPSTVEGIYALDIDASTGLVRGIHAVRNPDKLTRLLP